MQQVITNLGNLNFVIFDTESPGKLYIVKIPIGNSRRKTVKEIPMTTKTDQQIKDKTTVAKTQEQYVVFEYNLTTQPQSNSYYGRIMKAKAFLDNITATRTPEELTELGLA